MPGFPALGAGAASLAAGTLAIALNARHRSPFEPTLQQFEVDFGRQRRGHSPLRVGFVTDTHIGPVIRARDVERALTLLFSAQPDLVLFGGDYICESPRYIAEAAAVFGDYSAQSPLGAFAVLGNHDYANDALRLSTRFAQRGIRVLRNESASVISGDSAIHLVGVDDAVLGHPDLDVAFRSLPQGAQVITLWHEPDWAEESACRGASLQLSGHSHGGQARLPLLGPIAAPSGGRRFVDGLNVVRGMPVYTARGVGVYRPPIRFRCRPEVTLVTLG